MMFSTVISFFDELPESLVTFVIGIVGFLGVILSLRADRKVKVAEFIAEYNLTFLTTPEFTSVERKLEGCLDTYTKFHQNASWNESEKNKFEKECDRIFQTNGLFFESETANHKFDGTGAITKNYQSIVNYLVYLESFSTLITQKRVRIKDIDDLFGYRFFIAVNNPVLQENELIPYCDYYQGIFKAYKIWTDYYQNHRKGLRKNSKREPMSEYSLSKQLERKAG